MNHISERVIGKLEQLALRVASHADRHLILHENRSVVDSAALVEMLEYENGALKACIYLDDTIFDEIERVGVFRGVQNYFLFVKRLRLELEHQVEEHCVFQVGQVLHPFEHSEDELNLLVSVALNRTLTKVVFPLGVLCDDLAESTQLQPSERIVVFRYDCRAASTVKDECDFAEVVPIADDRGLDTLAAHMVPNFHLATAAALEEVDGGVVLLAARSVHPVVLLDHGFLRVA